MSEVGQSDIFGRSLEDAVAEAREIARNLHGSSLQFALFSGGSDSVTMLDICEPYINGVLHIDTTVGIQQTQDFVIEECKRRGLTLHIQPPPVSYAEIVRERGFFGPKDHPYAYRLLKKAAIREFKKKWLAPRKSTTLTFFTGMRAAESNRRMAHGALDRLEERIWWVNPIRHFSAAEKNAYIATNHLRVNPVSEVLGKSGECNCGCFAHPADKEIIRDLDPTLAKMLDDLETELEAKGSPYCVWGPGGGNSRQVCSCFGQEELAV